MPKFRPDLSARLKDIAKKNTGPREGETDSRVALGRLGRVWWQCLKCHVISPQIDGSMIATKLSLECTADCGQDVNKHGSYRGADGDAEKEACCVTRGRQGKRGRKEPS